MVTKVVVYGTWPSVTSGYAKVMHELLVRLDADESLEVRVYGIQKDSRPARELNYKRIVLHDAAGAETTASSGFGMHEFAEYVRGVQPDAVLLYNDNYVVSHALKQLREADVKCRVVVYLDMFYKNFYGHYLTGLQEQVDQLLVFTPYWKAHLQELGVTVPTAVVPHGFAADKVQPVPVSEARAALNIPQDAFVVLNWNRNLVRKRFDIFLMAWAKFVTRNSWNRKLLALLNSNKEVGFDVWDILRHEFRACGVTADGMQDALDTVRINFGAVPDATVNLIYNAADIGVNTAEGEGFGLCSFEHAGVGKAQVVARVGGLSDIFDETCAVMLQPRQRYYLDMLTRDAIGGMAELVSDDEACMGMEYYLHNPHVRNRHGAAAMQRVRGEQYRWDAAAATVRAALAGEQI